uniref:Putative HNH homing endonuclease n=1 Tax=Pediastrum duplex TaxID=3105 RepID=A0A2U8GIE2_PEDDU|nr:putative HNH homing endonuclease [Pediastrum duplex]
MCNQTNDQENQGKQPAKKYVTIPGSGGKRKWVRILPPKVRGKDKTPRKRGANHGNWKHGKGKSRPYDPEKYRAWKEAVLRNNNFHCFVTGEKENIVCHHLDSWDWCVERRYDESNGIALSVPVHQKFHSIYGLGQNTCAQFEQFLKQEYNLCLPPQNKEQKGNHEPSFTTEVVAVELQTKQQEKQESLMELINSRNHELISGEYKNAGSVIVVRCKIHDVIYTTKVANYRKSRKGMICCGKARQGAATAYHNRLRSKKTES